MMANPENLLPANEAALRHGAYAQPQVFMRCDRCPVKGHCDDCAAGGTCAQERAYLDQRTGELMGLPHLDPILDRPAVAIFLWQEIRILRAYRYLAAAGEMLPGVEAGYAEACPLAKDLQAILNSWARLAKDLGLTPAERRRLSDSGGDLADKVARVFAEVAERERGGNDETP